MLPTARGRIPIVAYLDPIADGALAPLNWFRKSEFQSGEALLRANQEGDSGWIFYSIHHGQTIYYEPIMADK